MSGIDFLRGAFVLATVSVLVPADAPAQVDGVAEPSPKAHPNWSPDGAWIAFDGRHEGNWDIYIVRPDGTELRRLTHHTDRDVGPRWSPDSRTIYFVSDREDGTELRPFEIDLASGDERPYELQGRRVDAWPSPHGRRVAYHLYQGGRTSLWLTTLDGAEPSAVAPEATVSANPLWTPDGSRLVFSAGEPDRFEIKLLELESWGLTTLTSPGGDGRDVARGLDFRRRLLLFHSDRDASGVFQTYLRDLESGETRQLTRGPHFNGVPSWSPDRNIILFESNRTGVMDLYLIDLDGESVRRLFR